MGRATRGQCPPYVMDWPKRKGSRNQTSFLLRQDLQPADAGQLEAKEGAAALFVAEGAGDVEMAHARPGEAHIARGEIAAGIAADDLAGLVENLHLLHAVVGHVEVAVRVEAHA